jgi:DNA segregation ATPase FtsK/SpoIIIE, S-DNA-T family
MRLLALQPEGRTPVITAKSDASAPRVPVGPLSIYDRIFLGMDEFLAYVYLGLVGRNILVGGEPGGGKSGLLNTICAHAALSLDCRLVLFDGKLVELGQWKHIADEFVGFDVHKAMSVMNRLSVLLNNRYTWLEAKGLRQIFPGCGLDIIVIVIDEIALYSATYGSKITQDEFSAILRDLVARGRAAGLIVVAATQRPSSDIIPTSLRDLFAYRCAFRCTTVGSSDVILGHGWNAQGYNASDISPLNRGEALLLAEGGIPGRIKGSYLSDADIRSIAGYAEWIRRPSTQEN